MADVLCHQIVVRQHGRIERGAGVDARRAVGEVVVLGGLVREARRRAGHK